jgi:hypothetical protein
LAGKHGPIELGKYLDVHAAAMQGLARSGKVLPDGDKLQVERTARGLLIWGLVHCDGGITVDVTKRLAVLEGEGPSETVQTVLYTYHVMVEGLGNLLRYCGPHDDEAHPDHKPFHHKHSYDVLLGDVEGHVIDVDPDARPTLSEVITEACAWYYEHADEIEARRASKA